MMEIFSCTNEFTQMNNLKMHAKFWASYLKPKLEKKKQIKNLFSIGTGFHKEKRKRRKKKPPCILLHAKWQGSNCTYTWRLMFSQIDFVTLKITVRTKAKCIIFLVAQWTLSPFPSTAFFWHNLLTLPRICGEMLFHMIAQKNDTTTNHFGSTERTSSTNKWKLHHR